MLLFLSGLSVNAHPGEHSRKKDIKRLKTLFFMAENDLYDGRLILKVKDKVGLTKEQEEKIQDLMLDHEAFTLRSGAEIKILELRFASYLKSGSDEMDRKQVAAHIREISNKKTDLIVHYMNHLLDLKEILTPDQVQKMAEIREKMKTLKLKERRERIKKH
jgi:Spy/CpxP family protein refolding chaperone